MLVMVMVMRDLEGRPEMLLVMCLSLGIDVLAI